MFSDTQTIHIHVWHAVIYASDLDKISVLYKWSENYFFSYCQILYVKNLLELNYLLFNAAEI